MRADPDQSGEVTRPVPWLTWALAAACLVAFLVSEKAALEADAAIGSELVEADAFLREHPYLSPPPLLEERLPPETAARLEQGPGASGAARGVLSRLLAREQAELDALVADAAARLERLPVQQHGLRASAPTWRTALIHPLLHGGWLHLLGNLLVLALLGTFLEGAFRRGVFAVAAAAGVAGSALAYVALNPGYAEPLIGAGGLLAGLFGAFLVRFRSERDEVPFTPLLIATPLVLVLPVCLGFEWSVARAAGAAPAVAGGLNPSLWALAGGCAGGVGLAFGAKLFGLERRAQGVVERVAARSSILDPQFQRAQDAQQAGQLDEAFNLLSGVLRRYPDDFDASAVLWQVASQLGRPRAASSAILRVIREEVRRGDERNAVQHWLEIAACDLDSAADTALLLHMVPLLRADDHLDEVARALRAALERPVDGAAAARVAARIATEAADIDPQTARDAAWRALGSPELGLEERQEIECLLSVLEPHVFDDADDPEAAGELDANEMISGDDLMAPDEAEASLTRFVEETGPRAPDTIALEESSRSLECILGVPTGVDDCGVMIELEAGLKKRLPFTRIEAIAVSAVGGMGGKPVVVVDLVLNWVALAGEPLRLIRLRTDRFDPRRLVADAGDALQALRVLVVRLLEETRAIPLPDLQSARGAPFAAYESLADYETQVLMIGENGEPS